MQRIRLSFALLAILLLVPLVLLLDRTLTGIDRERDQRHQIVASRVFDEAERTLTEFLEEEQLRPPEQYFPLLSNGQPSPLSRTPSRDFVIDYFQIDASGQILTPRPERASLLGARLRGLVGLPGEQAGSLREDEAGGGNALSKLKGRLAKKERSKIQRPGSTQTVQKLDLLDRSEPVERDDALLAFDDEAADEDLASAKVVAESYSSFEILERLNLAERSRARKSAAGSLQSEREFFAGRASSRITGPTRIPDPQADAATVPLHGIPSHAATQFMGPDEARAEARVQSAPAAPWSPIMRTHFSKSPMASIAVDDQHLILYRTTMIPGRGSYQQGLFLNLDRFAEWIEEQVVVESGLSSYIEFDLVPIAELGTRPRYGRRGFIYDHRFSEPFEELGARLSLSSLPDGGGNSNIYLMGMLLIAVSTVGLWAMYRRVAVAVHFAERRSNFAASVSHELKTPLTAIRMYAEMLRDDMVPDEAKRFEYYRTITSEAERLTRLINNVLEFSNLEKHNRKVAMSLAPIEPCLREVVQILSPHASSRGFRISLEVEPGLTPVRFEADALQQILYNLIDNALKYAETAERKEIEISARAVDGGICVCVRDFGDGVSKEHQPHLFEPFYRGETELTRRTKGTGIGLALVKGLVEEMNGEIRADNAAGGGFEVELRLRK